MYAEEIVKQVRAKAGYKGTSTAERHIHNAGVNAACNAILEICEHEPAGAPKTFVKQPELTKKLVVKNLDIPE